MGSSFKFDGWDCWVYLNILCILQKTLKDKKL